MIRPVIGTVGARVIITLANLLLVALAGRHLGAEGLGTISLLVLGVAFILILAHVVGGGGLVYLVPRLGVGATLLPAYAWAVLSALVALAATSLLPLAPEGLALHLVLLAFLQALNSIHLNILVGRERIGLQNTILVAQSVVQLILFALLLTHDGATIMDYVAASYGAYGTTVALSGWSVWRGPLNGLLDRPGGSFRALARQGGIGQLANLFQLFNYRAAYYFIEALRGTAALGVYSVAMQLAEGSWLVPRSIGGVLYSKVSNLEEQRRQIQLTVILFKVAVIIGLVCSLVLIVLPDALYGLIFGPEIQGLRPILLLIGPGLVAMSGSQVLSHYLSGSGRIHHNLIGSGLGLLVTLAAGWPLIGTYGLSGAALTASLAYSAGLTYQIIIFLRLAPVRIAELFPHRDDVRKARSLWHIHRSKRAQADTPL